jgi:hypothetical protein
MNDFSHLEASGSALKGSTPASPDHQETENVSTERILSSGRDGRRILTSMHHPQTLSKHQ